MAQAIGPADEARIVDAIRAAEEGSIGEVRVHVERRSPVPPLKSARRWFYELGMHRTAADSGILLYVGLGQRVAAIFAGGALHAEVDPIVWQGVIDAVVDGGRKGRLTDGICDGLARIGEILRTALPGEDVQGNELPDAVTTS